LHAENNNSGFDVAGGFVTEDTASVHPATSDNGEGEAGSDNLILSRSDAGEPDPAQGGERVTPEVTSGADDVLTGTAGPDTFRFEFALNARPEIAAAHADEDGRVDWQGVAGENNNVHDHWVDAIGDDVITGFRFVDSDRIEIAGHTVEVSEVEAVEGVGDAPGHTVIHLISQQGDGGGAHDEDALGTITVYGDPVTEGDLSVDSGVYYGAYEFVGDEPYGFDPAGPTPQSGSGGHNHDYMMG
jgi:hypothetical protein